MNEWDLSLDSKIQAPFAKKLNAAGCKILVTDYT